MRVICELNDRIILGQDGMSTKAPRLTARAILRNQDGLYAVLHAKMFNWYSFPGGGIDQGEDVLSALRREILEETGCTCDVIEELGIIDENRACMDYTQRSFYYIVTTTHQPGERHLTMDEQEVNSVLYWCTYDEMVQLITTQEFDWAKGKYLKARDVAALNEYTKLTSGQNSPL